MASNSDYAECILRLRNDEYAVLGLARGCSLHEARAVYKRLALSFHPDKADSVSPKQAQEVFHVITEAYNRIIQRLESAQRQHAMHGQVSALCFDLRPATVVHLTCTVAHSQGHHKMRELHAMIYHCE